MAKENKSELAYLKPGEIGYLDWNWSIIIAGKKISAVRKGAYPDGNCFFHSILSATTSKYRAKNKVGQLAMCDELRKSFADTLTYEQFLSLKVDNTYVSNDTAYESFITGDHKDPKMRYQGYKKYIGTSGQHVGTEVIHIVGKELNMDIYLMRQNSDTANGEYVVQPIPMQEAFLKRPSVILLYLGNHYELIGIIREGGELADFYYSPNHYVIQELYKLQKKGSDTLSKVYAESSGEGKKA